MSKLSSDLLSNALNAIAKHQDLIHEVYSKGRYIKNGSRTDRDAYELHQNRIFVADGRDSYRLSSFITKFFDEVTQKQRLFELLGDNASAQVNRIFQLLDEYAKAVFASRIEEADHVSAQFHDACADLSDTFSSGISKLLNLAETNFAVVNSIDAKTRQNEHYLRQARRFSDALESLDRFGIEQQFEAEYCDFEPLEISYRVLISDRKAEWHTEISRLLHFFETYLYQLRVIAPDVKRFRQFANFLQQNPGYELPELEETHHRPLWMMRATGIVPVAYSDVSDVSAFEYLREIAAHLPVRKDIEIRERESGRIERSVNKPTETLRLQPHHVALGSFAKAAFRSPTPLSALDWKRQNFPDIGVPDEVWLLLVMHSRNSHRKEFSRLRYQNVERRGESRISRNLYVRDVMVHGS
ncbi:MAG: hypothetical protein ACOY9D_04735 [Pseudomonadota bacterium]